MKYVFLLFLSLVLSSCGLFSNNQGQSPTSLAASCAGGSSTSQEAFKSTLHPSLQRNCFECHNADNAKAPSPFADDSPSIAFPAALRFADFSNPSNSVFVKRMEQGHNCGGNCQSLVAEFTSQIDTWKKSAGSASTQSCADADDARTIRTITQSVSSSMSTSGTTLLFDLKDATPPLPGAAFQVTVKPFTSTTFSIENPIFASNPLSSNTDQNIRVSNIHLFINGEEKDNYRNFVSTDFILQPRPLAQGVSLNGWYVVKNASQFVSWNGANRFDISFSIKVSVTNLLWNVPQNDVFKCKDLNRFGTFYVTTMNTCLACHDNGRTGYARFPMKNAIDAEVCREFKSRSDVNNPLGSLFYMVPMRMVPSIDHTLITYNIDQQNKIIDWLNNEK